ncbi:MAG: copper ion binding protein [Syntrophomonadaceae bacterium]
MNKQVISIIGMSCRHCQAAVENTVKAIDGVSSVKVDLTQGNAVLVYNEKLVSLETIKDAIEEIGYRCE